MRVTSLPATTARVIFGKVASVHIKINSSGILLLYDGATLLGTGTTALTDTGKWYRVALKVSNGSQELRVENNTEATGTVTSSYYCSFGLQETEVPLDIRQGPEYCLAEANQHLLKLLESRGESLADLSAVGVGAPGPVIKEAGMVVAPPIMPGWDHYPIRDILEKMWGCPVTLNNDAELGALGEWAYGAGRGEKNIAYIKVGSGIGAGLILQPANLRRHHRRGGRDRALDD